LTTTNISSSTLYFTGFANSQAAWKTSVARFWRKRQPSKDDFWAHDEQVLAMILQI
jgi:hypothetical protein